MEQQPKVTFFKKHPLLKDLLGLVAFVACVVLGTMILNNFVFRSYNVVGQSMENTFKNNDRVIVNRLPVTWAHFLGQEYVPERGDVIVFANGSSSGPLTCAAPSGSSDQYLIKRVIAFPGERVIVKDGVLTVCDKDGENCFNPDLDTRVSEDDGPKEDTSGEVDMTVPEGEIFVAGDNREGSNSLDSRSGLGTIPFCRIIGPVLMRIFPFDQMRLF